MQLEREHFAVNLSIGLSKLVPKERRRCVCAGIIAIIGLLFLIAALITNSIYNSLVSRLFKLVFLLLRHNKIVEED